MVQATIQILDFLFSLQAVLPLHSSIYGDIFVIGYVKGRQDKCGLTSRWSRPLTAYDFTKISQQSAVPALLH